jgi:hypothetical protein
MDPQYQKFANSIIGSANIQSPVSPLGEFPELANFFKSRFQLAQSNPATTALGEDAQIVAGNEQRAAEAARARAIAEEKERLASLEQEIEDLADPNKYQRVVRDDGGYDFLDPKGKKISALDYAKVTNKQMFDVLKDSQNEEDKDFVREYEFMRELGDVMARGDKKAYESIKAKYPAYFDKKQVSRTPEDFGTFEEYSREFKRSWPQYFQRSQQETVPAGNRSFSNVSGGSGSSVAEFFRNLFK